MTPTITAMAGNNLIIRTWLEEAMTFGHSYNQTQFVVNPAEADYNRSTLQKAIRRGLTDIALHHAQQMEAVDEKAFWFALSVIAGEDVGIGAPHMAALACLCTLKTFRDQVGNVDLLMKGLIVRLCHSNKNRFGCQLNVYADLVQDGDISTVSEEGLFDALTAPDPPTQFVALRELRKRCRHGNVELMAKVIRTIKDSFHSPNLALAAAILFERATDDLHYGLVITMSLVFGGKKLTIAKSDAELQTYFVKGTNIPYCALDQHTSIGRMALTRFAKTDQAKVFLGLGIDQKNVFKAVGALTFFHEASLVEPAITISDKTCWDIIAQQEVGYFNKRAEVKIELDQYEQLVDMVPTFVEGLNEIRTYLWKKGQ